MNTPFSEITDALLEECRRALSINHGNRQKILSDNARTEYGMAHGFDRITTAEEYRERVPVSEYSLYEERICTPHAFTDYPIRAFLTSSGTTGTQKKFPLTEEALKHYGSLYQDLPYAFARVSGKRFSASMYHPPRDGWTILSYAAYIWMAETGKLDCDLFVGGREFLFCEEEADIPYVKAWLMLSEPDIEAIQSIYLYETTTVFHYLETNWQTVIRDMKEKRVSAAIPEKYQRLLLEYLPTAERIAEIEAILGAGFDHPVAPRLWRKLKLVSGIGGKMYLFQGRQLRHYIGDTPVSYYSYACSECIVGVALFDQPMYVLLPSAAYYEFIPADGSEDEAVGIEELEIGKDYEIVITNFAGMYRYRLNDILRIRSFLYESPVFEVIGRRKYMLDITGEKTDVATATAVVDKWAGEYHLGISDFALAADAESTQSRYLVFIEGDKLTEPPAPETFDRIMREFSPDYRDIRDLGWLGMPAVYLVPRGSIAASACSVKRMAHNKPHIFLNEEQTAFLRKRGYCNGE